MCSPGALAFGGFTASATFRGMRPSDTAWESALRSTTCTFLTVAGERPERALSP